MNNVCVKLAKKWMLSSSAVGKSDPTWAGYTIARNASTADEREAALLSICDTRYQETLRAPLDGYFRRPLRPLLEGKDLLEIGCNHGGASLAILSNIVCVRSLV
jgi:hypothetical protein